jgi:hypothetical protein
MRVVMLRLALMALMALSIVLMPICSGLLRVIEAVDRWIDELEVRLLVIRAQEKLRAHERNARAKRRGFGK